jgi:DNA-binding Xre family transcriptional regulator
MTEDHPRRRSPAYPAIDPGKLTALRQQRVFLTQVQLAHRAGMSRSMISLLETGRRRRVGPDTLRRLCQALNCVPGDILTEEGNTDHATKAPAGSD